ncbi:unnamed protein product [Penicillium nalgiovense]|nr:unnamed protein product [Penicillium nalgiovense]
MATNLDDPKIDDDIDDNNCLLRGVRCEIFHSKFVRPTRPTVLFGEDKWKQHRKAKAEHVMVPSKEAEEGDFVKYPFTWLSMCRASECHKRYSRSLSILTDTVIKQPSTTKYFLSGITTIESAQVFCPYAIPKDPNVARIGGKAGNIQYDDTFIQFHAADIERQPSDFQDKNGKIPDSLSTPTAGLFSTTSYPQHWLKSSWRNSTVLAENTGITIGYGEFRIGSKSYGRSSIAVLMV